jgi:hypothetical protein
MSNIARIPSALTWALIATIFSLGATTTMACPPHPSSGHSTTYAPHTPYHPADSDNGDGSGSMNGSDGTDSNDLLEKFVIGQHFINKVERHQRTR